MTNSYQSSMCSRCSSKVNEILNRLLFFNAGQGLQVALYGKKFFKFLIRLKNSLIHVHTCNNLTYFIIYLLFMRVKYAPMYTYSTCSHLFHFTGHHFTAKF